MVVVSYPERVIHGVICRLGGLWNVPRSNKKAGRYPLARQVLLFLVRHQCRFQASRRLNRGQDTQSSRPGNRLCPVMSTEFAVDIACMGLDRVQREEKPGCDFWIG